MENYYLGIHGRLQGIKEDTKGASDAGGDEGAITRRLDPAAVPGAVEFDLVKACRGCLAVHEDCHSVWGATIMRMKWYLHLCNDTIEPGIHAFTKQDPLLLLKKNSIIHEEPEPVTHRPTLPH